MEEPRTRAESGARYSSNVAQGQARVHYGNNYIEHQNITNVASNSERSTAGGQLLDFVEALKFGFMDFRLDSIDPPHADTCTWLFQRPEYIRWRDPTCRETNSNLLWIKGKAGSGKSTIMKCAYEYIKVAHQDETVISFFFNARGHVLEKSVEGMYRSILSQALQSFPALRSIFPSHAPPDVAEKGWPVQLLRNLWRKAFSNLGDLRHSITLLIDALDECPEEEIREALEHFEEFGQQAHSRDWQLYICLASRYYPQITLRKCEEIRLDEQTGQKRDISEYVKNKLKLRNRAFSQELEELICHRSSQVFLWVVLVVRRLNAKADHGCTRSQLIAVLNEVPEKLEGLLAYIIEDPDDGLIRTVQLVSLARDSLNVGELYSAVRHSTDRFQGFDLEREYTNQYDMESFILNASRGLVEFATSRLKYRAQFIHEFVREYMLDTGLAKITNRKKDTALACSHADLAKCCQTYFSLNAEKSLADKKLTFRMVFFLSYAMSQVYYHMESAYVGGCLDAECLDQFPWRTWIIRDNRKKHRSDDELAVNSTTFIYLAFQHGCKLLARALLQRYAQAHLPRDLDHGPALSPVITSGQWDVQVDLNAFCGGEHHYLITAANKWGDPEDVRLLLENGANPNPPRSEPLLAALLSGNLGHARILLQYGASSDSALQKRSKVVDRAMQFGDVELLELLLELGAEAGVRIGQGLPRPILAYATRTDRENQHGLVGVLAKFGEIPQWSVNDCRNQDDPFRAAARNCTGETLHLILDTQVHPPQLLYDTLLCAAVKYLNAEVLPLLLSKGGDANVRDLFGCTLLYKLASRQDSWETPSNRLDSSADLRVSISRMLLEAGADANAVGGKYDTALIAASANNDSELVQLLLKHGANAHYRSGKYGTALDVARKRRLGTVVRLLQTSSTPSDADSDTTGPS